VQRDGGRRAERAPAGLLRRAPAKSIRTGGLVSGSQNVTHRDGHARQGGHVGGVAGAEGADIGVGAVGPRPAVDFEAAVDEVGDNRSSCRPVGAV